MTETNEKPQEPMLPKKQLARGSDYLVGRKLIQFRDELAQEVSRRPGGERGADALAEALDRLRRALEPDHPAFDSASADGDDRMVRRAADWLAWVEQRIERLRRLNNEAQAGALLRARDRLRELLPEGALDVVANASSTEVPAVDRPLSRSHSHEAQILRALRELGHDPAALPKALPGRAGVRAQVRERLQNFTNDVFKKAWQRLRDSGQIAEAK